MCSGAHSGTLRKAVLLALLFFQILFFFFLILELAAKRGQDLCCVRIEAVNGVA